MVSQLDPIISHQPWIFKIIRPFIRDHPNTLHTYFLMYAIILLPNNLISFISTFSFPHSSAWHLFLPTHYNNVPHTLWYS